MTSGGEDLSLGMARVQRLTARWDLSAELRRHQARRDAEDWELVSEKGVPEDQTTGYVAPL
jgi:hypothetical protein